MISIGGEVANAQVCKTCIRGLISCPVLQIFQSKTMGRALESGGGLFGLQQPCCCVTRRFRVR